MTIRLSTAARDAALASGILAATIGSLTVRTGSQPATPNDAATGTLLVQFDSVYFGAPSAGAASLDPGYAPYQANAVATGTAGWARLDMGSGVVIDGTVASSGGDFTISSTSIASGDVVQLQSFTLTMPAA